MEEKTVVRNPNGYMVRFVDGPFAGKETHLRAGIDDPPDEIVAFELQMLAPGVIGFLPKQEYDDGIRASFDGDHIYRVRNRSQLPDDVDMSHIMRGAEYTWVSAYPPTEGES